MQQFFLFHYFPDKNILVLKFSTLNVANKKRPNVLKIIDLKQ